MGFTQPLPSNRKLPQNTTRTVDLDRGEFQRLIRVVTDSILGLSNFNPKQDQAEKLRKIHEPLYGLVKRYAEIAFEREFDAVLMFGISVESLNLVNGKLTIKFTNTVSQKDVDYRLKFRNHLTQYSEELLKLSERDEFSKMTLSQYELV